MPKGIKSNDLKLQVKVATKRTISLPRTLTWEDGARFTLRKVSDSEFKLVPDEAPPPPA